MVQSVGRLLALAGLFLVAALFIGQSSAQRTFTIQGSSFVANGQPVQLIGGSIHYFRVHPDLWEDRLTKLKAMGANMVQTYVPWNMHQPEDKAEYVFTGILDVVKFVQTAQKVGLYVNMRASPYICAEFEFGGFPYWLRNVKGLTLRATSMPLFDKMKQFYDTLLYKLRPFSYSRGGPIIMYQIENEYGSYGSDEIYLDMLHTQYTSLQVDTILNTCNGGSDLMMLNGNMPSNKNVLRTVNFNWDPQENLAVLRKYQPTGPLFVTEYWTGWFDFWNGTHHTTDPQQQAGILDYILSQNASANQYMFHGGTSFGYMNGANHGCQGQAYQPIITSYDYDAPLSEAGDPTAKFTAFRSVISQYISHALPPIPQPSTKIAYGAVQMTTIGSIFDPNLFKAIVRTTVLDTYPLTMEELDQGYGFVWYQKVAHPLPTNTALNLELPTLHDRAQIWINSDYVGTLMRDNPPLSVNFKTQSQVNTIDILVENMGRINFGPCMVDDYKGIKGVQVDSQFISFWFSRSLPVNEQTIAALANVTASLPVQPQEPAFYRGSFTATQQADTFLNTQSWNRGVVFINGFNLGRYWSVGPQQTLYVPGPLIKVGANEIVIFELHNPAANKQIVLQASPILG